MTLLIQRNKSELQTLNLGITGPPGSGKGTFSKLIAQEFGLVHISSGELLRKVAPYEPEILEVMKSGGLVPAERVLQVIEQRLKKPDVIHNGFILDGFPRCVEEAIGLKQMLERLNISMHGMIKLNVETETLLQRILKRGRLDDTKSTFMNRIDNYAKETIPVHNFLRGFVRFFEPMLVSGDATEDFIEIQQLIETQILKRKTFTTCLL